MTVEELRKYKQNLTANKTEATENSQPQTTPVNSALSQKDIDWGKNVIENKAKQVIANINRERTPEELAQLKEDSIKRQTFKKKADAGYFGMKTIAGIGNANEGITDAAQIIGGKYVATPVYKGLQGITSLGGKVPNKVSDTLGKVADYSWDIRPKQLVEDEWSKEVQDLIDKQYKTNAVQRFVGDTLGGVAGMAPTIAANIALPGAGYGVLGLQGAGSGIQNAYKKTGELGAKEQIYGALSGGAEAGIEALSGGIAGLGKGGIKEIGKKLIKSGFIRGAIGEGVEEGVSTVVDPLLQRLTYDKNAQLASPKDVLRSAGLGTASSLLIQGGSNLPNVANNAQAAINAKLNTNSETAKLPKMDKGTSELLKRLSSQNAVQPIQNGQPQIIPPTQAEPIVGQPNVEEQTNTDIEVTDFMKKLANRSQNINNRNRDTQLIADEIYAQKNNGEFPATEEQKSKYFVEAAEIYNKYKTDTQNTPIGEDILPDNQNVKISKNYANVKDLIRKHIDLKVDLNEEQINKLKKGIYYDGKFGVKENPYSIRIEYKDNKIEYTIKKGNKIIKKSNNSNAIKNEMAKLIIRDNPKAILDTPVKNISEDTKISKFASSNAAPKMDLNQLIKKGDETTQKTSLSEIEGLINNIVPVKTGKFRQKAYGIYKDKPEIVRTKQKNDVVVAVHELTHHLDKVYGLSNKGIFADELISISRIADKKGATQELKYQEGLAEFGRYYMTDKEYAKEIAPNYYDVFEHALNKDPQMKAQIDTIQAKIQDYLYQTPENRILSHIDFGDEGTSLWGKIKTKLGEFKKDFRKNFVDDKDPIKKIVEDITGGEKLAAEKDPYTLLRLNNGVTGKTRVALEYGILDEQGEKISKSFQEVLEPVKNNMDNFVTYLSALRAKDLQERKIETGFNSKDVDAILRENENNKAFKKAADELYEFQDIILIKTLVKSGIITAEDVANYKMKNPHYVPFNRVMDENFKKSKDGMSKTPKKIRGSTRDIINPLESIIKNVYSFNQIAEQNDAYKSLFDLAKQYDGTGKWFDKVPVDMQGIKINAEDIENILGDNAEGIDAEQLATTIFRPAVKQKGNVISVMNNGKPTYYEIMDKDLFEILAPQITNKKDTFFKTWLVKGANTLRAGATLNTEFPLRNPIRDTIAAGVHSKNDFIPFVDTAKGIFEIIGRSDLYYKWLESGASGSSFTNAQRKTLQNTLKGITPEADKTNSQKAKETAAKIIKHPLRTALDVLSNISNLTEEGTKVGEFRKALQNKKSVKQAAFESRDLMDFSKGGAQTKELNRTIAFLNARVIGVDKLVETFKERPMEATIKALTYITLPTLIIEALTGDDERNKDIPQWERDTFWAFYVGDTPVKIPKPQGLGEIFATIPQRAIRFIKENDKDAFDGLAARLLNAYSPIDSFSSAIPTAAQPVIENLTNYSFFKQQPIVNQTLEGRSPRYQYDQNTSEVAKTVGNLVNYSPKKIDNLISGLSGNLGKDVTNLMGVPISLLKGDGLSSKEGNATLRDIPVLKGFIANDTYDKETDNFYNELEQLRTKKSDVKAGVAMSKTDENRLAELEKKYREIQKAKKK